MGKKKTLIAPVLPLIIIVISTFYIKLSVFFFCRKGHLYINTLDHVLKRTQLQDFLGNP